MNLVDTTRHRTIPVALYGSTENKTERRPLAVISPGYEGQNTDYSFIANDLVEKGYVVASIQHDLPGDPPIASEGDLKVARRPNWQAGVDSILFVIKALRTQGIADQGASVTLIGHSNGGDMSMLFATEYPGLTRAVLSLDNRRMPLPRVIKPRICSIRSSDQQADAGVLPDAKEIADLNMLIAGIPEMEHNNMWDGASDKQKEIMLGYISACLNGA
ncbi:hypothetical protein [Pseudaminobacter soli (ex Li et al. 2025)]|uniref:hypothetical protein n=1 Tax=Pseudaminobacter soli (ex Li et al. 2025) TaxID=1295366 RepID=UPI002473B9B3|nr:hypothetical protein [Mesorhizobium soli]